MKLLNKLVYIEWRDVMSKPTTGWQDPSKLVKTLRAAVDDVCASVGWVLHYGKDCIVLVAHRTSLDKNTIPQVDGDIAIPRGLVKKIKVLSTK